MIVDFIVPDFPLVQSAHKLIKKALERAASAVRQIGHNDDAIATDLHHLEAFEARYNRARVKANGEDNGQTSQGFASAVDVPAVEAAVIRTGILLLLQRHTGTADKLQSEIDLEDKELGARLGDMRNLGLRLGGQGDLFAAAATAEKRALVEGMGLSASAVGVEKVRKPRVMHKRSTEKGTPSEPAGRRKGKRGR